MAASRRSFLKGAVVSAGALWQADKALASSQAIGGTAASQGQLPPPGVEPSSRILVDLAKVTHTMAGGIGTCWHALGRTGYWYGDLVNKVNRNCRGSAWGGNPPLNHTEAWQDLRRHARWLGLNFNRITLAMRMYEPAAGKFHWQGERMCTLYRILDYCEEAQADVFLSQMWADVQWNAFPAAGRLQSAPKSVEDFAAGMGALMEQLVKVRHYTCIRWLCIVNEPGNSSCWWLGQDGQPVSLMPALHAVRSELDRRGIQVGLSGPDWSSMAQDTQDFDFSDKVAAAFDAHNYNNFPDTNLQKLWAERAHARKIPFFQTEFGTWTGENPFQNPTSSGPRGYANQMVNAEKVIGGINAGVDGFSRWNFTNRGDLDGQWQLVRTFDPKHWQYFKTVEPEPVPYFCYGILTRFMAKHSSVVEVKQAGGELIAAALRSPNGNLTVYILNQSGGERPVELDFSGLIKSIELKKYQVTETAIAASGFELNPSATFPISREKPALKDVLPPLSLTTYSTYNLPHSQPGIFAD